MEECKKVPNIENCLNCYELSWCCNVQKALPNVNWDKERAKYYKQNHIALSLDSCISEFVNEVESCCHDASYHNINIENYEGVSCPLPILIKVAYFLIENNGLNKEEYFDICYYYETFLAD